ncbi:IS1380 family transposase, partial [Micromonospora sp. NPDC007230]
WRYTAFVTNTAVGALQWLEARHRAHARVEDRAARLVRGQRRRRLRIPSTWPWAEEITAAFTRIAAIPAPG